MPVLILFYKVVVLAVYRTVNQLSLRLVVSILKLIILVPPLLTVLILVAINLLHSFCPHQLLCHHLFLQYQPSIHANLFQR